MWLKVHIALLQDLSFFHYILMVARSHLLPAPGHLIPFSVHGALTWRQNTQTHKLK